MYIYFKRHKSFWTIADVGLKHGYIPHIGNISPDDLESNKSLELEPAIWFKCLLIDSLLIDCDRHEVRWTRRSLSEWNCSTDSSDLSNSDQDLTCVDSDLVIIDPPSPRSPRDSTGHTYDDDNGEIYDGDCVMMEELFDQVHEVLEEYVDQNLFSGCKNFHVILFRILHCYILPKIILTKDDIPLLHKALSVIEERLVAAELDIEHGVCGIELVNNSLKSLRARFVDEFQNDKALAIHEPDFLKILLKHLEKDIESMEHDLNCTQNEVNRTKEELEHSENRIASDPESSIDDSLKDIRMTRDQIHKQAMKLKLAKEHIRNQIMCAKPVKRKRMKGKAVGRHLEFKGFQASYIMVNQICQEKTTKMEEVYLQKLKIISVREAIRSSLDDLKDSSQTLGVQMKSDGSEQATDIFAKDSKNVLWMTSEERIGRLVSDPRSKIRDECVRFCKQFNERVDGIFSEDSFLTISESYLSDIPKCNTYNSKNQPVPPESRHTIDPFLDRMGHSAKERRSTRIPSFVENYYSANDVQSLKQRVEQMKNEIVAHVDTIAWKLSRTMKGHSENKLRICYEGHFYPLVMNQLYRLYEASCYGVRDTLTHDVAGLSPIDLGITEPWLLMLLTGEVNADAGFSHPVHDNNPETEDHLKCDTDNNSCSESGIGLNMEDVILKIDFSRCSVTEMYKAADFESAEYRDSNLTPWDKNSMPRDGTSDSVFAPATSESGSSVDSGAEDTGSDSSSLFSCFKKSPTAIKTKSSIHSITRVTSITRDSIKYKPKSSHDVDLSNFPDLSGRHEVFCQSFKSALDYLKSISRKSTILSKLKLLTKAFRFINMKISALRSSPDAFKGRYMPCCDDMLTLCIILLTQLSGDEVFSLFVNLSVMIDLMSPSLNGGVHDCSLINFHSAFQYILDSSMLLKNKKPA